MYMCSQAIMLTFDLQDGQTADVAKETEEESKTTTPCKPAVIRDNTMVTTAQVRETLAHKAVISTRDELLLVGFDPVP